MNKKVKMLALKSKRNKIALAVAVGDGENTEIKPTGSVADEAKTEQNAIIKSQKDDRAKVYFVIQCPHCGDTMFLYRKEIKCGKIRHGTILSKNRQLHFNTSDEKCVQLLRDRLVIGCTKPFRVTIVRRESSSSDSSSADDEWLQVSVIPNS